MIMLGEELPSLPPLTARHWFSIIQIFEQLSYPETSLCWNIFYLSGLLSNLCLPWKTECALNSLYWIYIFNHSKFWTKCACPEKQSLLWKFSLRWNIFYLWSDIEQVLRRWREATNSSASMKTFDCYDIVRQFYRTDTNGYYEVIIITL